MGRSQGRGWHVVLVAVTATWAVGCGASEEGIGGEQPVARTVQAVGDPVDGYPSYQERVQLVAINRVRADPNNTSAGTASSCSTPKSPVPPVMYDMDLGQSARFHCIHSLINQGGLSHKSFCELREDIESSGCDGKADCSCKPGTECWSCETLGGCGTGPSGRATIFGFTGSSVQEVGAAGADSWGSVRMWTGECPTMEAHRNTLTSSSPTVVGTGYHTGSGCWGVYAFANFGKVSGITIARIPSAVHVGATFYANYYDPAGDPKSIHVVIDGVCNEMTVELGEVGHRTYLFNGSPAQGCQEYYFVAVDQGGQEARYPTQGSLTSGSCPEPYVSGQKASDCASGVEPGTGGSAGSGTAGTGGGSPTGGSAGKGTGGSPGTGGSAGPTAGSAGSGASGASGTDAGWWSDDDEEGGCACSLPGRRSTAGGASALLLLLGVFRLRSRRS